MEELRHYPIPPRIEPLNRLREDGYRLRWRSSLLEPIFLTFFSLFWCGFLVVWYAMAVKGGAELVMIFFPLLHVAAGVGIAYYTSCLWLNFTEIRMSQTKLMIKHGPLPWRGGKEIRREKLRQIYVMERQMRQRDHSVQRYDLMMMDAEHRGQVLLKGLREQEEGLFLKRELEKYYGIEPENIAGAIEG